MVWGLKVCFKLPVVDVFFFLLGQAERNPIAIG